MMNGAEEQQVYMTRIHTTKTRKHMIILAGTHVPALGHPSQ